MLATQQAVDLSTCNTDQVIRVVFSDKDGFGSIFDLRLKTQDDSFTVSDDYLTGVEIAVITTTFESIDPKPGGRHLKSNETTRMIEVTELIVPASAYTNVCRHLTVGNSSLPLITGIGYLRLADEIHGSIKSIEVRAA